MRYSLVLGPISTNFEKYSIISSFCWLYGSSGSVGSSGSTGISGSSMGCGSGSTSTGFSGSGIGCTVGISISAGLFFFLFFINKYTTGIAHAATKAETIKTVLIIVTIIFIKACEYNCHRHYCNCHHSYCKLNHNSKLCQFPSKSW